MDRAARPSKRAALALLAAALAACASEPSEEATARPGAAPAVERHETAQGHVLERVAAPEVKRPVRPPGVPTQPPDPVRPPWKGPRERALARDDAARAEAEAIRADNAEQALGLTADEEERALEAARERVRAEGRRTAERGLARGIEAELARRAALLEELAAKAEEAREERVAAYLSEARRRAASGRAPSPLRAAEQLVAEARRWARAVSDVRREVEAEAALRQRFVAAARPHGLSSPRDDRAALRAEGEVTRLRLLEAEADIEQRRALEALRTLREPGS